MSDQPEKITDEKLDDNDVEKNATELNKGKPKTTRELLDELTLQHSQRGIETFNTNSGGPVQKR